MELADDTAGLQVIRTTINYHGVETASSVFVGATWTSDGKLVPIANTANTEAA